MAAEITCSFSRAIYPSDSIISASICSTSNTKYLKQYNFTNILIQACGHVVIDNRWSKLKNLSSYYDESIVETLDDKPIESRPSSYLRKSAHSLFMATILETKIGTTSFQDFMDDGGIIVQFQLPGGILCSYRGLSLTVQYHIVLKIMSSDGEHQHVTFPFQVMSIGSAKFPFKTRLSEITVFPYRILTSRTHPQYALHETDITDHDYGFDDIYQYKTKLYNLSNHEKLICSMEISSLFAENDVLVSYPGNLVYVKFSFGMSQQPCSSVKVSLVQMEERSDKTKVQEQVISSISRCTMDALVTQSKLYAPESLPCSCEAPTAKISYAIRIELLADMKEFSSKTSILLPTSPRGNQGLASRSIDSIVDTGNMNMSVSMNGNMNMKRYAQVEKDSSNPEDPFTMTILYN